MIKAFILLTIFVAMQSCKTAEKSNADLLEDNGAKVGKNNNANQGAVQKPIAQRLELEVFDPQTTTYILDGCSQLQGLLKKGLKVFNEDLQASQDQRLEANLAALNIDLTKLNANAAATVQQRAKTLWWYHYEILPVTDPRLPFAKRRPSNVTHVITRVFEGGSFTPIVFLNVQVNGMTMDIIEPTQMYNGLTGTAGWLWGMAFDNTSCKVSSRSGTISSIVRSKTLDNFGNEVFLYNYTVNGQLSNPENYQVHNLNFIDFVIRTLDAALIKPLKVQRNYLLSK